MHKTAVDEQSRSTNRAGDWLVEMVQCWYIIFIYISVSNHPISQRNCGAQFPQSFMRNELGSIFQHWREPPPMADMQCLRHQSINCTHRRVCTVVMSLTASKIGEWPRLRADCWIIKEKRKTQNLLQPLRKGENRWCGAKVSKIDRPG